MPVLKRKIINNKNSDDAAPPLRTPLFFFFPLVSSLSQDWDDWGLSGTVSTINSVVNNLTSEADVTGKSPASKWKVAAQGVGAGSNSNTPNKVRYTPNQCPARQR